MHFGTFGASDILNATIAIIYRQNFSQDDFDKLTNSYLHSQEQQRRCIFKYFQRRDSFTIGRLAAKLALKSHLNDVLSNNLFIGNGVFNQPIIQGASPQCCTLGVSTLHSDNFGVAVIHHKGHPIGVDIDQLAEMDVAAVLSNTDASLTEKFFDLSLNEYEVASVLWVARESLGKVLTTGMMVPPSIYAPSSITRCGAGFNLRYENFKQYQTDVIPIAKAWLAMTFPAQTEIDLGCLA